MGGTRATYTYTRFFSEDDVAPLVREFDTLVDDWRSRIEYVDADTRCAGNERVEAVRLAIARLTDPAT